MRIIPVILCAILFKVSYQCDISIKDVPFVVSLYLWPVECTGIVISTHHILTAKHCLANEYKPRLIFAGSDHRKASGDLIIFNRSQEFLHPDEDMAIIHLPLGLQFGKNLNAISLPTWSDAHLNVTGKEAFVTGWKSTLYEKEETYCDLALQANNITISLMESKKIISVDDKSTHIAAGAPLIINQTLWGVASADDGKTQIYCSVPQQLKWISETTGIKFKN